MFCVRLPSRSLRARKPCPSTQRGPCHQTRPKGKNAAGQPFTSFPSPSFGEKRCAALKTAKAKKPRRQDGWRVAKHVRRGRHAARETVHPSPALRARRKALRAVVLWQGSLRVRSEQGSRALPPCPYRRDRRSGAARRGVYSRRGALAIEERFFDCASRRFAQKQGRPPEKRGGRYTGDFKSAGRFARNDTRLV
jgi:hypothetical protein